MTLLRYSAERYRCFVDPVGVEVRRLTLLFGRNASGKSALARVLPLLAQAALSDESQPLALNGTAARGARYDEIASRLTARNALVFSAAWEGERVEDLAVQLRDVPDQHRQIVEQLQARIGGHDLMLRFEEPGSPEDLYDITWERESKRVGVAFTGLKPAASDATGAMQAALETLRAHLMTFGRGVHWLTAVRRPVERVVAPVHAPKLKPDGDGVEEILAADARDKRALLQAINPTYIKMFAHEVRVDSTAEGAAVVLTPAAGSPIAVALADTGEGASQVLAVMVLGALARTGALGPAPVLVFEQPEMHLHPGAERDLAAFLADVAMTGGTRVIVETHSENLLLFVQLALAERRLTPDDVAVYFVRPREGDQGSVADPVRLDPDGRPRGWPPGVFSEDVALARELLLAQRRKAAGA